MAEKATRRPSAAQDIEADTHEIGEPEGGDGLVRADIVDVQGIAFPALGRECEESACRDVKIGSGTDWKASNSSDRSPSITLTASAWGSGSSRFFLKMPV